MKTKYEVGGLYGLNNSLLLLERVNIDGNTLYKVQCQICKLDHELHGDATYLVYSDYLQKQKMPCGCSKAPKWSKKQWEILLKRKAKENNHVFNGFLGDPEKVNQSTKIILHCNNCGHDWTSGNVGNYYYDRGCPKCADKLRANSRLTESDVWIERFRSTGKFDESKYTFERVTDTGRLWNVYCNVCNSTTVSDRSNLVAGKVPCGCGNGGGIDVTQPTYFYILTVTALGQKFIKFGISNYPKRRIADHRRTLKEIGGLIETYDVFIGDGSEMLAIESDLKRTLDIQNKFIDGFKREACRYDDYPEILSRLEKFQVVTDELKI